MQTILAGGTEDFRWDPNKDNSFVEDDDADNNKAGAKVRKRPGGYVPAAQFRDGPVFRMRILNFWEAQDILDDAKPRTERIRTAMERAIVSIDGSTEGIAEFIKNPKPRRVLPLFDVILEMIGGN